jgi:hypothetical protein
MVSGISFVQLPGFGPCVMLLRTGNLTVRTIRWKNDTVISGQAVAAVLEAVSPYEIINPWYE